MRRSAGVLATLALTLVAWSCGGEAEPEPDSLPSTDSVAAADRAGQHTTAIDNDSAAADTAAARPLRNRRLAIVNPRGEAVVVTASAGLEAVVLDTLPPRDSSEVNVESRAPMVLLRAVAAGRPVGEDSLDLTVSEPARWAVPTDSAAPPPDSDPG